MMKKGWCMLGALVAVSAVAFMAGCSDDSSSNCCVDSGDTIDITIPGDETEGDGKEAGPVSSSSTGEEVAASSGAEPASSAAESSESKPASSAGEAAPASSEATPASSETAKDWRDYCLEVVNAKRATENIAPLVRASEERENCVVKQAAADMAENRGHANFGDCGEFAQNTGPNINTQWYGTPEKIVDSYVNMMWDEEKALVTSGERDPDSEADYPYIGHYLNMKKASYKSLACGIAYSEDGKQAWFNMNFY